MKLLLIIVGLCAVHQTAFAPSGRIYGTRLGEVGGRYGFPVPPPSRPVYQPPPPKAPAPPEPEWHFRIVEGQVYNIINSERWAHLIPKAPLSVVQILPEGVVLKIHEQVYNEELGSGSSHTSISSPSAYRIEIDKTYNTSMITRRISLPGGMCFVRNLPGGQLLTVGERVAPDRFLVMRVLPFQYAGQALPTFDCGAPITDDNRTLLVQALAPKPALAKAINAVAIK